jgi:hypothetical protein
MHPIELRAFFDGKPFQSNVNVTLAFGPIYKLTEVLGIWSQV